MRRFLLAIVLLSACWAHAGTIIGQYQTATGGVVNNATLTFTLSQSTIVPGSAGIVSQSTTCYTANSGQVVGVPDLLGVPTVATSSSGHLPAGTYYVQISYLTATTGEGAPSPERKIALTTSGSLIVSAPVAISNASGYAVYIGTTSGGETLQGEVSGWGNYTQATALVAGSSPMASNTSACGLRFSDEMIPTGTYYSVQMLNAKGTRVSGFPQTWCTYGGSGGTVDISRGVPTGSCATGGVYYPTPILATPLAGAGALQSINGPLQVTGLSVISNGVATSTATAMTAGTGAGNYTTTSATMVDVDAGNLAYTVTVPAGWTAKIEAVFHSNINSASETAQFAIADGTTDLDRRVIFTGSTAAQFTVALAYVLTGDDASHTFKLRYQVTGGAALAILNNSRAAAPKLIVTLMPSS